MKRFIRIAFAVVLLYGLAEFSTWGWNFSSPKMRARPKNLLLAESLKKHVRKLSEDIGDRNISNYENLGKAAKYIKSQLKFYGCNVRLQDYDVWNKRTSNIIYTKTGLKVPEEIIVISAHYDSYFNPGADDDASGVAAVLELARLFKYIPTDRTIEFVFFVNEEPPFFKTESMGSRVFARTARVLERDIRAVITLDMIGYYSNNFNSQRYYPLTGLTLSNRGDFIALFGNSKSRQLAERVEKSFKLNPASIPIESFILDFDPSVDFSDHWAFWKEGYPAIMICDTVFLRSRYYHTSSDVWQTLNYENMAGVVEGLSYSLVGLANAEKL